MLGSENVKRLSQERSARALSPQLEEEAEGGGRAAANAGDVVDVDDDSVFVKANES